jgi:hypothetical protein
MTSRLARRVGIVAAAITLPLGVAAAPAFAAEAATVSVLHAIPGGLGADSVDVFAGDALLIDNFTPGTLETLTVPAGAYNLAVYADGEGPGNGDPILSADGVEVPAGANATVTANLDADGAPALNVFVNDISSLDAGQGRVTVRHIAAAPAVDILVDGTAAIMDLANPEEVVTTLPAGDYEAAVALAGTTDPVLGPVPLAVVEGVNTIVYAWGSAADGTLDIAVQTVEAHTTPPVPAGGGSTAGLPLWAVAFAGIAAVGVVGAAARLAAAKR